MTAVPALHPKFETLLHSLTSLTGHSVALEPSPSPSTSVDHQWEVVGATGDRYGVLRVRADGALPEPARALYTQLSEMMAREADLHREKLSLEQRFRLLDRRHGELTALHHSASEPGYRDSLTGLYRRWYVVEQVRIEITRSMRHRRPLSLLVVDVDDFASLNARIGTTAGDAVLQELASRLAAACRTSDVLGRAGGDEFCALLADTPADGARELALRIHQKVCGEPFLRGSLDTPISATLAVVTTGGTLHETADALFDRAAVALSRAKRMAKGRVGG